MWETRKIRLAGQQPSFSLQTSMLTLAEHPMSMDLVNTGETATELRIDCSWSNRNMKLYTVSLGKHGHVHLKDVPIAVISQNQETLTVKVTCKDSKGKGYNSPEIKMDFAVLKAEDRESSYQYNPIEDSTQYR